MQTDGKIVAGGYAQINNEKYFALARYEFDGSCDYTFNGGSTPNGTVLSRSSANTNDEIFGLAFAAPGDIIAVGRCKSKTFCCGAVARFLCEQDLDCPEIAMPCDEQIIINGAAIKLKGSCQKMSKLQIYLDDKMLDTICARGCNRWEYMLPPLSSGPHSLQVCERYDAGNMILHSKKIKILVDQHPQAINQSVECHGIRNTNGMLAARGASGTYIYRIMKETNCKVTLHDDSSYSVRATIPCGQASFDFEVEDTVTHCSSKGCVTLVVREIPKVGVVELNALTGKPMETDLGSYVAGGQKPYQLQIIGECKNGSCLLKPDGKCCFVSDPEFLGTTDLEFVATDCYKVSSDPSHVLIKVNPLPHPVARSVERKINADQKIAGDLNECISSGTAPFQYKIVSAKHGKILCNPDGSYIFTPSINQAHAEFNYIVTDAYGISSNLGTISFRILSEQPIAHELELPQL